MKREDDDKDINYDPMMPHMAGGGFIDPSDEAASLLSGGGNGTTFMQGGAETLASPPDMTQMPSGTMTNRDAGRILNGSWGGVSKLDQQPQIAADPIATPPNPAPAHVSPDVLAPKAGLPGIPQDSAQDALNQLLSQQKEGLGKYGPEQQMAVQKALIEGRTGLGPSLARAGGGLADAIMQGVARAGPSHFQENITNQQNQLAGEQMGTMKEAQAGKMAQMKAQMQLSQEDPNSPLSKIAQQAEGPTLISLGAKKEDVAKMPASLIGDFLAKKVTLTEALARIQQEGTYQRGMLANKQQELDEKKNEFETGHPIMNALFGKDQAASSSEGAHGIPDLGSTFNGQKVIGVKKIK